MDLDTSFGGSDESVQEPTESVEPSQSDDVVEDLANPFLKNIPPQDRAVVARYLKDWNSGAQKKFREYNARIKPYEELGSLEDLTRMRGFVQQFRTDPEGMFRVMWEGLENQYGENMETELLRILGREIEEQMSEEYDGYEGTEEPDPDEIWRSNAERELAELREWKEAQEQQRQEQAEFAALDDLLGKMHNQFGEFDDDFILTRLGAGRNLQEAWQDWQALGGKYFNGGTQRQAPKVLGGQGGVPSEQVDATKLRGKQRRDAVQALLSGLE